MSNRPKLSAHSNTPDITLPFIYFFHVARRWYSLSKLWSNSKQVVKESSGIVAYSVTGVLHVFFGNMIRSEKSTGFLRATQRAKWTHIRPGLLLLSKNNSSCNGRRCKTKFTTSSDGSKTPYYFVTGKRLGFSCFPLLREVL